MQRGWDLLPALLIKPQALKPASLPERVFFSSKNIISASLALHINPFNYPETPFFWFCFLIQEPTGFFLPQTVQSRMSLSLVKNSLFLTQEPYFPWLNASVCEVRSNFKSQPCHLLCYFRKILQVLGTLVFLSISIYFTDLLWRLNGITRASHIISAQ